MAFDWGSFFGSALAGYFGNKGTSGDTPNFYPVPMTPEEKRWDDERWRVYQQGGSPNQQAMSSAARQFLQNMPTTANPQFASPMMQGQQFAGGIQLPKIDLSGVPWGPPRPGPGPTTGAPKPGDGRPEPGPGRGGPPDDGGDPFNPPGGNGPFGPDPRGLDRLPNPNDTPREWGDGGDSGWYEFRQWADDFRLNNPNWTQTMIGAATALFGPLAAGLMRRYIFGEGDRTTIPGYSNSFGNVARNAPGTRDRDGNAPAAPPAPYTGYQIDPRTGQVTRNNPDNSFGGTQGRYYNDQFWRGLQTGGITGPTSGMGMQPSGPQRRR
jgi:hypothetical protein